MTAKIIFEKQAIEDVKNIKRWYRLQKKGLENDFVLELKHYIHLIENYPSLYQIRYKNLRAITLKRFPYLVYYLLENDIIYIVTILAAKQNQQGMLPSSA